MTLYSLECADVSLRIYSLSLSLAAGAVFRDTHRIVMFSCSDNCHKYVRLVVVRLRPTLSDSVSVWSLWQQLVTKATLNLSLLIA